jgi:hypothetical protein
MGWSTPSEASKRCRPMASMARARIARTLHPSCVATRNRCTRHTPQLKEHIPDAKHGAGIFTEK